MQAHPVLAMHLIVFGFSPCVHHELAEFLYFSENTFVSSLLASLWLYLLVFAVNRALNGPCREHTRRALFVYRIVLVVLVLSILIFLFVGPLLVVLIMLLFSL